MKIRTFLILMIALVLIPTAIFGAAALKTLLDGERVAALRNLEDRARAIALIINSDLASAEASLQALSTSNRLASRDLAGFYQQAKSLDRVDGAWTVLLDAEGQQLINTAVPFGTPLPSPVARPRAQQVLRTQSTLVSDLILGPLTGKLVTTVNVPAVTRDGTKYVLVKVFDAQFFAHVFESANIPASQIAAVIDKNGKFIARSQRALLVGQDARPELVKAGLSQNTGMIRHHTLEGTEVYDVFTRSGTGNWIIAVAAPVTQIDGTARRAVLFASFGFIAAVLLGACGAMALARNVVTSLGRASRSASALASGQALEAEHSFIKEVDTLHTALQKTSTVLIREKESRKKAEVHRQILLLSEQKARQAAEQENKAKDIFLAMLAHELRNPLGAITSGAAVARRAVPPSSQALKAIDIIDRQASHLAYIVDDLLDLARLNSGKIVLARKPVNLEASIQACAAAQEFALGRKNHVITFNTSPLWVNGDPTRIEQVISNLLTNACKYTPEGGTIDVSLIRKQEEVCLTVQDSGIGISPELMPRLFNAFVQADTSLDRAEGGLGIGLALVKRLVDLHDGRVHAVSAGVGQGSSFAVTLPLIEHDGYSSDSFQSNAAQPRRVLIIEDNEDVRSMMVNLLQGNGHEVFESPTGEEGVKTAVREVPEIAFIDIGLPGIDGLRVARTLRATPETKHVRLVALSGYGSPADLQRSAEAGFDHHLIKPAGFAQLEAEIARLST
jgi:signal transduction histidine kinase